MEGKGELKWPDGRIYVGVRADHSQHYENDKKSGKGIFTWPDGRKFMGVWKDGKQHGIGIYWANSTTQQVGQWSMGKRVKWLTPKEIDEYQEVLDDIKN